MPSVNLLENISVNTTFLSWNSISCYRECVSTCPKTDNGLNFTTWCLLVSNTKTSVDYVNVTLSFGFDSPSSNTNIPSQVPQVPLPTSSTNKEIVLSAWFVFTFGLAGIIGGLESIILL